MDEAFRRLDGGRESVSLADLIEQAAGVPVASPAVIEAFEYPRWAPASGFIADYRTTTGRAYPPVYRVHITVEAEALSDEEAAAWWAAQAQGG